MMPAVRSFVAAFAILAVLLTAGAVGAVRGQAMAAGEIVLCAGGAAVTVPVDAEGRPTGPPHWCPDCVLSLLAGVPPAAVPLAAPATASAVPRAVCGLPGTGGPRRAPAARGPPVT
jgi:hypothetical protein